MPVNTLMMSGRSQKKWNVHSYGAPASHGPIGARLEMHGVLVASHTAPTGLVVSGVWPTTIRSTLSPEISPCAASPALVGLDWLSTRLTLNLAFLPSTMMPLASSALTTRSTMNVSAAVNGARGPVWGLTYPILSLIH